MTHAADDDEDSKDWWTKYFASVEAMIEVKSQITLFKLAVSLQILQLGNQRGQKRGVGARKSTKRRRMWTNGGRHEWRWTRG
jgi:hypothetical protein